jgi:hypothetical protein
MSELSETIFASATEHDGKYLLAHRRKSLAPFVEPTPLDKEYDACHELVFGGYAIWINGNLAPGIRLTGKPLLTPKPEE